MGNEIRPGYSWYLWKIIEVWNLWKLELYVNIKYTNQNTKKYMNILIHNQLVSYYYFYSMLSPSRTTMVQSIGLGVILNKDKKKVTSEIWRYTFLFCFAAIANVFHIFRQCTYIVCILQCKTTTPKQLLNCLKRCTRRFNRFFMVSSMKSALILLQFSYYWSTWIRYQKKIYLGQWPYIVYKIKTYPVNASWQFN